MASRRGKSSRVVAVLFIVLLVGCECSRIRHQATIMSSVQDVLASQQSSSRQVSDGSPYWRVVRAATMGDVCRRREMSSRNGSAAAQRYVHKCERLNGIAAELGTDKCSKGCPKKWIEFKSRVIHFSSCAKVTDQNSDAGVPQELVNVMASENTSLSHVFTQALGTVGSALQKNGMFPVGDKCSFYPSRLNITSALASGKTADDARRILRAQLLGQDCDKAAEQQYLNSLSGASRRTAHATMAAVDRVVKMARVMQSAAQQDTTEISKEVRSILKDTKSIVEGAKFGDVDGSAQLADKQTEEEIEMKQASEDDETSNSASLLEADMLDAAAPVNDFTWFEVFVGILITILIFAFIGAYVGPVITGLQAAFAAGAAAR